jgi:hypothetical protein
MGHPLGVCGVGSSPQDASHVWCLVGGGSSHAMRSVIALRCVGTWLLPIRMAPRGGGGGQGLAGCRGSSTSQPVSPSMAASVAMAGATPAAISA